MTSKRFQARHGLDNNNQTITRVSNPVNNTDAANKQYVDAIGTTASNAIPLTQKGAPNGVATLDSDGLIPTDQLPSYVDEVQEFPSLADFPIPGLSNKIYVATDVHKVYRWSGSEYVDISASAGTADEAIKLATARNISISGDVTGTTAFDGTQDVTISSTLKNSGVTVGTYTKVTVNSKGIVTNGTALSSSDIPALDASKISTGTLTVGTSGNAATATKLATPRTISLTGDVTGSTSFDGSQNASITAVVADNSHNHTIANVTGLQTALDGKQSQLGFTPENSANKGAVNGYASLDSSGKVPSSQLPSYVDDVLEFASLAAFPVTGESGKIYIALNDGKIYRWSGSAYILINSSVGSADTATKLATPRTISLTGDVTGSTSFDGSQNASITAVVADNSHNHTIANVTGLQTALDGKLSTTGNAASATKLQTTRTISASGDATGSASFDGSANATIPLTLKNSGVTAGTYTKVTVDAAGRATAGESLSASDIPNIDASKITSGTVSNSRLSSGIVDFSSNPTYYPGTAGYDLNTMPSGSRILVAVSNDNLNEPPSSSGTTFWYVECVRSYTSEGTLIQKAWSYNGTPKMAIRSLQNSVWQDWVVFDAFNVNASNLTSGTVPDARLPTTMAGKTFSTPINVVSTFDVNGSGPGRQQNGLYIADLGSVVGSTNNPVFTTALAWQISSARSNAIAVDSNGYIWGYRSHSNAGTYTFKSKTKEADKLAAPVTINGVSFDGSANITVEDNTKLPLTGGTLTGGLSTTGTEPQNVLHETDTDTRGRIILSGGALYLQAGAPGAGAASSSGNILFTGLNDQDIGTFKVKFGGTTNDIWHAGNMADVSQAEAEAGTATTRRAWTAQRVRQAVSSYALPLSGGTISGTTVSINPISGNAALEIGGTRGVASTPFIDFHSGATTTDYDSRILASGGDGTVGKGTLTYTAARHNFVGEVKTNTGSTTSAASHYFVATGSDGILRPKTLSVVRSEICTSISNDASTNATYYPVFATATSGAMTDAKVSSTKLTFNPSTGDLSATNFNSLSDVNYKENVVSLEDALGKVVKMNGYSYDWKDGSGSSYGVIAQELIQIAPDAVSVNAEGKHTVNYAAVVPFLIEAIKEQQKQIEELKSKLG